MRRFLYQSIVRIATALLTPIKFSMDTGHFKSSVARKALDRHGNPLPWYTYPAIDFLSTIDFSDQKILEFGAGQSTLWWAKRAVSVFSVENDTRWFNEVKSKVSKAHNVDIHLCSNLQEFAQKPLGRQFDVVIIDGGDRFLCAQTTMDVVANNGCVILDNSEGFWSDSSRNESYPIIDLFKNMGYMRVDFYGYAPGVIKPSCTSIFFKEQAKIFKCVGPPVRQYNHRITGWKVLFSRRRD